MLKILGIVMIIAVCGYAGVTKQKQLAERKNTLQKLIFVTENIASELSYGKEPMQVILLKVSGKTEDIVSRFLQAVAEELSQKSGETLDEIWQNQLPILAQNTDLTADDLQILTEYGSGLGVTHTTDQLQKLSNFNQRLQQQEKIAAAEYLRLGKVFQASGWCLGLVLVLLLF